jgi:acyl-CoA synthetase (AMP-forming)/AMP-acid ligase II
MLLETKRFDHESLPDLRRITIAGGALHRAALETLLERFPDAIVPMYGLTEAATRVTSMPAGEARAHLGSCGKPIPGVELRILDENAREVPSGETGEIVVRGPNLMQGYFGNSVATKEALRDGWLHTGDLGSANADGYLTICGRRKDIIKVLGESVSAVAIESVIAGDERVAEVAVVGLPDPRWGEVIAAFVVSKAGGNLDLEDLRRRCAQELGRARVPARLEEVPALPRTASGKVRKHVLIAQALDAVGQARFGPEGPSERTIETAAGPSTPRSPREAD